VTVREVIAAKSLGLALALGGWVMAVGGLLAGQAMMTQMAAALVWLAASLGTAGAARSAPAPTSRSRG